MVARAQTGRRIDDDAAKDTSMAGVSLQRGLCGAANGEQFAAQKITKTYVCMHIFENQNTCGHGVGFLCLSRKKLDTRIELCSGVSRSAGWGAVGAISSPSACGTCGS